MPRLLTSAQQQTYHRDGIVFPLRVLTPDEARRFRHGCDELESRLGGRPRTVEVRQMHLHFRWACDLAMHPRILDAVEDVLGPDLLIWATELFAKHPQDAAVAIGWHRDRPYMGFDVRSTVTAWIALSESSPRNGGMRALPGEDRGTAALDEARLVDVVLQPGEMSLHDSEILHGSVANLSDTKRVGFVVRYVSPAARPLAGRPPAILARGRYQGEQFQIVDPPPERGTDDALAALRRSAADHLDAMLENLARDDGTQHDTADAQSGTDSGRREGVPGEHLSPRQPRAGAAGR